MFLSSIRKGGLRQATLLLTVLASPLSEKTKGVLEPPEPPPPATPMIEVFFFTASAMFKHARTRLLQCAIKDKLRHIILLLCIICYVPNSEVRLITKSNLW